jgi:hypothetical protein
LLSLKNNLDFNLKDILEFKSTMPIVPKNERIKPTSKIIKGLNNKRIKAVKPMEATVSGLFEKIEAVITTIPIMPALITDGLEPAINTKKIIEIMAPKFENLLPH